MDLPNIRDFHLIQSTPGALQHQKISDVMREFLANFLSDNTRLAYAGDLKEFLEFLATRADLPAARTPREITRLHVIAYRDHLRAKALAPASLSRKLSSLSSIFNCLCEAHLIDANPVKGVRRPSSQPLRPRTGFTDGEVVQIEDFHAEDEIAGLQRKTLLTFLFRTGCRVTETCSARVPDLHFDTEVPFVRIRGKGERYRDLPLHPKLCRLLKLLIERRQIAPNEHIFTRLIGDRSKPLTRQAVAQILDSTLEALGLDRSRSPHSSRRTVISHALERGAKAQSVQKLAGHASLSTTTKYNVRDERLEDSPLLHLKY